MLKSTQRYTLKALAEFVGGALTVSNDYEITALNTLQNAGEGELAFLSNRKYQSQLSSTKASAVLVTQEFQSVLPCAGIIVDDPYLAFAKLSKLYDWRVFEPGIDKTAVLADSSVIDSDVYIGPGAIIGQQVHIQRGAYVGPNAVVGDHCRIGAGTRLEAGAVLYPDVYVGSGCIIHSGAVLGADGFGFARDKSTNKWVKICQLAGVRIGNDVEIGAGTTVDRGALDHTYIHDGVKLDNQIQVAHNVVIGESTAIAGCTAIAGSTHIGRNCTIAGLSGITGHLVLADNTHVTAMTLVSKSITESGQVISSGTGQDQHLNWKKNVVRFKQLNDLAKRVTELEKSK